MKTWLLFFSIICINGILTGQEAVITLTSPHSGGENYDYLARDEVRIKPGFLYSPQSANNLHARIDEDMVLPVNYSEEPIIIDERTLDPSLPVGATAGSHGVSLSGAATYQIPVIIPPGTGGMEPSVSMVYNSQAGNGLLGYGWNLSGLSSIIRIGHTIYHDGEVKGVDFDDDRFALDGNRLVAITGAYGADQSVYYTENFNASRITSHESAIGGGPLFFTVETKDGKTIEYGNTDDSRVETEPSIILSRMISWNINKITDRKGNYIEFVYHKSDDHTQYRIKEIRYTGNDLVNPALEPYNTIHFYYSEREDKHSSYIAGSKLQSNVLLDHIKVFAGNSLVRNYKMNYHYDFYSHLIEVQEFNDLGQRYNSTVFECTPNVNAIAYLANDLLEPNPDQGNALISEVDINRSDSIDKNQEYNYEYFTGDYNGDGKTDLLQIEYLNDNGWISTEKWTLYGNQSADNNPLEMNNIDSIAGKDGNTVAKAEQFSFGDLNGDGLSDILQLNNNGSQAWPDYKLVCYFSKPNDNSYQQNFISNISLGDDYGIIAAMDIVEVNGDGQADILLYCKPTNESDFKPFILLSDGTYSVPYHYNFSLLNDFSDIVSSSDDKIKFADFNADGRNDILVLDKSGSGYKIYHYDEDSNSMLYWQGGSSPDVNCSVYTGDFNGDGYSDLLYFNTANQWKIRTNTGLSFIETDAPISNSYNPANIFVNYLTGDFNGDGKDDIWEAYYDYDAQNNLTTIYYSNENSFDSYEFLFDESLGQFEKNYSLADWNGDGKTDIFTHYRVLVSHVWAIHFSPLNPMPNMIHSIADGFDNRIDFSYKPLTYGGDLYTKNEHSFVLNLQEVIDFQGAFYVVSDKITNSETDGEHEMSYYYAGATIHKFGKGFFGFSKTISQDITNSAKTVNIFRTIKRNNFDKNKSLTYLYYAHVLDTSRIYRPVSDLISETSYIGNIKNNFDNEKIISLSFVQNTTSINYLKDDLTITTDFTVDDYGNILTETTNHNGEGTTTTTTIYASNSSWCDYLPDYVTVNRLRTGKPIYTTETDYMYRTDGLLQTKQSFANLPKPINETFDYDDFGNVTSKTLSTTGEVSRSETFAYDPPGRFVTGKTNILGHQSFYTFDHRTGNMLNNIDIQGLTTTYRYDGFGRKTRTTYPDGNQSKYTLNWDTDNPDAHILYYTQIESDGAPLQRSYHDKLGREIIQAYEDLSANMVFTKTTYDDNGRVETVSEPYYEGSAPGLFTTYHYDEIGRVHQIDFPTHTETTAYDGTTTTLTNSATGISKSATTDAFGLTIAVSDPTGTINYEYFSSGQTESITAPDGSVFAMTYDEYDRQETLTDPDAGTVDYEEYTGFGELKRQVHAGRSTETEYDDYGRPDIITYSYGGQTDVVNYDYVEQGNGLGQIQSISQDNGIAYNYTYDSYGRISTEQETIDGQVYENIYTYDNYSNLQTMTWPSGYTTTNTYDRGYLTETRGGADATLLYASPAYNVRGQPTYFENGNGRQTTFAYDDYGFPELYRVAYGGVLSMKYNFDPGTGNLNWREELTYRINLHEGFSYDDYSLQNRLTGWGENDEEQFSIIYSGNGNIRSKTDVSAYTPNAIAYSPVKPHALTQLNYPTQDYLDFVEGQNQQITYNAFDKTETIEQANKRLEFVYGPDQSRKIMKTYQKEGGNFVLKKTKYYILGNTEAELNHQSGETRTLSYIANKAIWEQNATTGNRLYYLHQDYQGSLLAVTDESGDVVERYAYDPWGRRRNPTTWKNMTASEIEQENFLFLRGYTGHEHLDEFCLINMNGRMYDPLLGRMLSPDNYVQAPGNSQNFNRYSYCINNPLIYTDPNGEWAGWDDLIVGGVGFAFGYVSYGLANGDWGWRAAGAGAIGAGTFLLGYYSGGATSAGSIANIASSAGMQGSANTIALGYGANMVAASTVSSFMPSVNVPFGDNVSVSVSPAIVFGSTQKGLGVNVSGTIQYEGFNATLGTRFMSYGSNYGGDGIEGMEYWALGYDNGTSSISYSSSYYSSGETSQQLGAVSLRHNDFGFTYQNDYMFGLPADGGDRYRTAAAQFSWGDFSAGVNLFTGDPGLNGANRQTEMIDGKATYKMNGFGDNPNKYRAGVGYVGYGNMRFGSNSERIRNIAQNKFAHDFITGGKSPYFQVLNINRSNYFSVGTSHPYTLW
jgi:RHS repeat-associated protein